MLGIRERMHPRTPGAYCPLDLLPLCPDRQSWSGRWSLWHCSTEAGHAWGHQLFCSVRPPQHACRRSAPLEEKPAGIRGGEAAALPHTRHPSGRQSVSAQKQILCIITEVFLRMPPRPSTSSVPATVWDLDTVLPAVGFGDLLRPRSVH